MNLGIQGKRALVMASSAGIGRGIAKELVDAGAKVVICARNADRLNQTCKEINASLAIQADLSQRDGVRSLFEKVEKEFGGIDIVVFNSGGPDVGLFKDISYEKWQTSFQDTWGHVLEGLQWVLPKMRDQKWGRIVLITSVSAKEPVKGLTLSTAFRAGLLGLVNSVSREQAEHGITMNVIMPGYIDTERLRDLGVSNEKLKANVPAGRIGTPSDVGALTAFLVSDRASYITGQAIACDGGYLKGI